MRKSVFLQHLKALGESELRDELDRLYDNIEDVRRHYKMELGSKAEREKFYEKAKKTIDDKFKTRSYRKPRRPRVQKLNLFIKELEKTAIFPHEMIEIYLHTVEIALDFMFDYRFSSKPVINTTLKYYEKGLEQIRLCRLKEEYKDRCAQILRDSTIIKTIAPAMTSAWEALYGDDQL